MALESIHNQILHPVILPVPEGVQKYKPRDRVLYLSRHARRALERSAARSGIRAGELLKDTNGMPLPFDGTFWSITHKTQYVGGVVAPTPIGLDIEKIRDFSRGLFRKTGPYEQELRAIADKHGGRINFLGYCSGDKLWELIRKARAVVLPSQWYENAPISILEAYASGKPVIGARIGGIPEMLIENETGHLFESGEIDELSSKLSLMHTLNNSTIASMGRAAREHVSNRFTPQRYLTDILQLYESLNQGIR